MSYLSYMNGSAENSYNNFDRLTQILSQLPFVIIFSDVRTENNILKRKVTYISETIRQFGYPPEEF